MAELFTDKTQARGNVGYEAAVAAAASAQAASDAAQAASEDAAQAALDAQNAASLADGKAVVFFQPDQPAAGTASLNDIWIDSNSTPNANQMWVFNGTTWVLGSDQTGAAALAAAATANNLATGAQAEADRKIITYVATTAPTAEEIGDLWINPSSNNEMRRWNGTSWVVVTDTRITQAASDIVTLQGQYTGLNGKVDSKAVIWYQNTAPTGLAAADQGDMWVNTSTTNRVTQVWSGTQWQDVADQKGIDAYASAGTKIITYYSSTTPTPTAPAVAFTTGDLWVDLGNNSQIKRWSGSAWVLLDVASTAYIASQATDLVTNGTGLLGNNYNFATYFDYVGGDSPTGANGSFIDKTSTNKSAMIDEYISFDPAKKYKLSFQMRQTVAGQGAINRAYGFIAPYDAFNGSIAPVMYMYVANTTTTLAADLKSGDTVIRLTNAANWYGSAANPAGGTNTYLRGIIFWDYVDAAGKAWPVGSYTRNVYYIDKWADGGVDTATGIITLRAPYSGPTHLAGTAVSNSTSGGSYMYMPSCTNVLIPETWTAYSDLYTAGTMSPSTQSVALSGAATWAGGVPPGTAKLKVGWLTNYPSGGGKHAVAAVSFSDASYATQTADTAATNANTALAGVDALDALNPNPSFVSWAGANGTAPDNWTIYTTAPTKETSSAYYRTPPYAVRFQCTDNTTLRGIYQQSVLNTIPNGIQYMTFSADIFLISGSSFGGSGILLDWIGMANNRVTVNFSAEIPTPTTGKWYRITKVLPRPANATGTQTGWTMYLMGQYGSGMGTMSVKDFSCNFLGLRPSTTEEITAYNSTALINTKATTFYQGTVPTSLAAGDIWYDSANGNRMYRAAAAGVSTIGAGAWVLTQDTAIATAQATAAGKNNNYYATFAPTNQANVAGDLWFVRDPATDNILSLWQGLGATTWMQRQVTDQTIANLNVGKLVTGNITAGQEIVAGDPNAQHASMKDTGFYAYAVPPDSTVPFESVRMGTVGDNFAIADPTGAQIASINTNGIASFQGLYVGGDDPTYSIIAEDFMLAPDGEVTSATAAFVPEDQGREYTVMYRNCTINTTVGSAVVVSNDAHFYDNRGVQTVGGVTLYNDIGRTITAPDSLPPGTTIVSVFQNLVLNGNFEYDLQGWNGTLATLTMDSSKAAVGTNSMRVTSTTASGAVYGSYTTTFRMPVSPSTAYSGSCWVAADTGTLTFSFNLNFYKADGSATATLSVNTSTHAGIGTTMTRITKDNFVSPPDAAYALLHPYVSNLAVNRYFNVDGVMLVQATSTPASYYQAQATLSQNAIATVTGSAAQIWPNDDDPYYDDGCYFSSQNSATSMQVNTAIGVLVRNCAVVIQRRPETIVGGMVIYGTEFQDWLDQLPQGIIASAYYGTNFISSHISTEYGIGEVSFVQKYNRNYRVTFSGICHAVYPSSSQYGVVTRLRYTSSPRHLNNGDGIAPTITSTIADTHFAEVNTYARANSSPVQVVAGTWGAAETVVRVLATIQLFYNPTSGYLTWTNYGGLAYQKPTRIVVEDIGIDVPETWQGNAGNGIVDGGSTGTAPPAPTKKNYVSTWNATDSETYQSSGSARSDTTDLVQGYNSYNGDGFGSAVFMGGAVAGETGKTIATALSGATVTKVEVYLYAYHWYYNAGGTAVIRVGNNTTVSHSSASAPTSTKKTISGWPKPAGKWVDVTSISTASTRAVWVGKAGTTSLTYYGRFYGHTVSSGKPQIRFSYTR